MLEKDSQIEILLECLQQAEDTEKIGVVLLDKGAAACPAQIRLLSDNSGRRESTFPAQVSYIGKQELRFTCPGDQARSQRIEVTVTMTRSVDGESQYVLSATVAKTSRIPGGYEFSATIQRIRKHFHNAHRIFAECVARNDTSGWNQWYAPMTQSVDLKRLNLSGLNLSQFDLGSANLSDCDMRNANLSGANLSGANLDGCILDGAVVDGADFFGAALPAKYESLIKASGLLERESVILLF